jgi:signal transduction histidine kinase/CheY-like chemotaxis protein/ligand-binding sensor domain-containing protein/HPt (histidine-containing phosphotransfer) domain-containing protein
MNKWKKGILTLAAAVCLNVGGRLIALHFGLPAYLNLCGTILASYLAGPVVGTITAVLSCAVCSLFSFSDWYFLIADIAVAISCGLIAKKNKFFSKFSLIFSATAFFAIVKAVVLVLINLSLYGGKSGLFIADAIIDYLGSLDAPYWLRYLLTAICISFTDSFAAVFKIYIVLHIGRSIGKRKKAKELKKQLMRRAVVGILAAAFISSALVPMKGTAAGSTPDESISFVEKLYNSDNGLVGGCVNDMAMTKDGSMWLATYGGLFRFNGSGFILMDNLKSVRSVQSLYVDGDDRLWAGTQDAGLTLLNIDMTWRTLDMSNGLPSNSVKCISRDSNGLYYFGTTAGLVVAEYNNGEVSIVKTDTDAGNIKDLAPDKDGHMIVMDNIGGVSYYEKGVRMAELKDPDVFAKGVNCTDNGLVYVGTDSERILIYDLHNGRFCPKGHLIIPGLKSIRDFYFDESGIIYVAADNGIGYFDTSRRFTGIETGEFNNSIDHIYKDYQGNIWFTSSRCGLLCLGRSSFTDVFKLCNEKSIVCNAARMWNGYLYVGSNSGLKILDVKNGKSIKNEITDELDGIRIRSIEINADGNLIVATYDRGVAEIAPDNTLSEYVSSDETGKQIRVVSCLSDGTVIASSDAGMTFMKDHKVLYKLKLGEDLGGGTVLNILEVDDHSILCGTDGDGIAIIRNGKLDRYITRDDGLSSGVVLRVVKDTRSDGYFILTGSGLCYMNADFTIRELGMPYYNNFDIAMNSDGEIFVLGGAGIYISDYNSLMNEGRMETYTLLDSRAGLPGSITSNAWNWVTDDAQIYICGTSGIYLLDLNNYEMTVNDFRTKITSITFNNTYQDVTEIGIIEIPRGTEKIDFTLEINNYTSANPYVSYFLSGVDDEKTIVLSDKLGTVTYYDIPYGNHDFVINVIDEKGRILSTQTYVFAKEKELYETIGFLLYFYLVLFTFFGFIVTSIAQGALWSQQKKEKGRHELVVNQLEREKAEALERALHMEEDANRTKSEFLANMSHEIRTPINAIIGMDTMIMRESSEANIRNYARDIHSAGKTLLSLINDILDFSKIESGKLELVPAEYNLSGLINGIVNMIAPKAEAKKLELEVNVDPDIPNGLYGDEVRIEQIIVNILNNAVKYTEKGKVSFNVGYSESEGGAILLQVSIKDTGIGIKAEDLEKLFSPYERIEEQRNKKIEGTGLGMSITKNLLEKMGSRLEVASTYGEGSTFSFGISQLVINTDKIGDYRQRAEERDITHNDMEKYHAPDAKILIVDDVEMNLIVAKNLLKRIQIQIDTVMSGKEAVEMAKENQYDIIFLDSMMPEMNGEETMQAIKKECPVNAETPIIVLTAHAVKGAREEYLRLGYTNYLSKPLDGNKLEAMIQSYLPDEKISFVYEEELKAKEAEAASESGEEQAGSSEEIARISAIEGIDAVRGVETAGGEDAYLVICRNFYDTAKMRIDLIKDTFEKEDYENYTIQVHALKSSARLIGAFGLSAKALELETAGREGDAEKIKADTAGVVKEYEWFYNKLDEIFGEGDGEEDDDRPLIDEDELKQCLGEMDELLEAFDMDTAGELLGSLSEYRMPDDFKDTYKQIKAKMAELDRDGVLKLIRGGNADG